MKDKDLWESYCKMVHSLKICNSKAWAQTNLTMPQIKILFTLAHRGELNVSTIAEALNVKVPNVTFILDHLENQKLVSRKRSRNDRRLVLIDLTSRGMQLTDQLMQAKRESFQKALDKMGDDEKKALLQGLQALERACISRERGDTNE